MAKSFENWNTDCLVCGESITNPICTECLGKEIVDWAANTDPALVPYIRLLARNIPREENETKCIVCGNRIDTCNYCFLNEVLQFIRHNSPELTNSFLEHFSYFPRYTQTPSDKNLIAE
ncbi:MAG: hypothetical protein ABIG95_04685 [Candidatus Woesearchaeota archaeon]